MKKDLKDIQTQSSLSEKFSTEIENNQSPKNLEITISIPAKKSNRNSNQLELGIEKNTEYNEIGMGVLSDGTPYLNQRGLSKICGVENAHIGTISSQWNDLEQKPRIQKIKAILSTQGTIPDTPHHEVFHGGQINYCYPSEICLAIIEYYAFDAGQFYQEQARNNYRLLAGSKLKDLIYAHVGYDPTGKYKDKFKKWHERIELNHQSAPSGFYNIFNEANTLIYELIVAGADVGEKTIIDISIGQHWGKYWQENNLENKYGDRNKYPHRYPDSHPQSRSNPQIAWCYPLDSLGEYRKWLNEAYIDGGKFSNYLNDKVKKGDLPISVAQLAIKKITPNQIENSKH